MTDFTYVANWPVHEAEEPDLAGLLFLWESELAVANSVGHPGTAEKVAFVAAKLKAKTVSLISSMSEDERTAKEWIDLYEILTRYPGGDISLVRPVGTVSADCRSLRMSTLIPPGTSGSPTIGIGRMKASRKCRTRLCPPALVVTALWSSSDWPGRCEHR